MEQPDLKKELKGTAKLREDSQGFSQLGSGRADLGSPGL